ncbi:hypothetical protein C6497_04400 [Candidatus Poribacteria bacterium]|nr:MAG: hypothetical protein C6497_04400 [Candidatus Poribacteria bacterium]
MKTYYRSIDSIRCILSLLITLILTVSITNVSIAKREKEYVAKQIDNIKIDGKLNEWVNAEVVNFDQLKDVGVELPKASDFSGNGRVAWSANDPTRIYFAVEITDDKLQDINPDNARWWEDDSVEFMFDFDNEMVRAALVQWTLGANGKDHSAAASRENTEWVLIREGTKYTYEVAIDAAGPRGPNPGNANAGKDFKAKDGLTIGLSFHMNDCENGQRQHQIGWIAGQAWDALAYGDLTFDKESLDVEPSGKLALTWGAIKR